MSVLPPRRALAVVAIALAVGVSWQLGRLSARWVAVDTPDGAVDASRAGHAPGAGDASGDGPANGPAAGAAATATTRATAGSTLADERDAALAGMKRLERELARSGRTADDDAAELELYRRIESGDRAKGLSIDAVELVDAGTADAALEVTLVQSRGRRRVTGSLDARLLDAGPAVALPSSGGVVRRTDAADGAGIAIGDGPASFDLRFYQTLRLPLGAAGRRLGGVVAGGAGGAEADSAGEAGRAADAGRVRLEVHPDGDRHEGFVAIVPIGTKVAPSPRE